MDRTLVYAGEEVLDIDKAGFEQFAMISDGFLAEAFAGAASWAYGLACAPTAPASMSVTIGRGCLGQMSVVDNTAPGTAQIANTTDALMKIGINLESLTLSFTAPGSSGQSQNFLVQGQMLESDGVANVPPFYNASNPSQPFAGQNNNGGALNTRRTQRASIQTKAGAPANTGTQATPAPDTGFIPLYIITVPNGATSLSAANIVVHPQAPFLQFSLAQLRPGFSNSGSFGPGGSLGGVGTTNWTVPNGVTKVKVRGWSGGGGGGGSAGTNSAAAGGGGGSYFEGIFAVAPGQVIAVTVGGPGTGGAAGGNNGGSPGGATSFGGYASAGPGTGGGGAASGGYQGTTIGGGGTATGGSTANISGTNGVAGFQVGSIGAGGAGGNAFAGSGAGTTFGGATMGQTPGGGGAGGANGGFGGTGGSGLLILEW
jgi:hypothetical protein